MRCMEASGGRHPPAPGHRYGTTQRRFGPAAAPRGGRGMSAGLSRASGSARSPAAVNRFAALRSATVFGDCRDRPCGSHLQDSPRASRSTKTNVRRSVVVVGRTRDHRIDHAPDAEHNAE